MQVWNPQLEQHLNCAENYHDGSAAVEERETTTTSLQDESFSPKRETPRVAKEGKRMDSVYKSLSWPMMEWMGVGFLGASCCICQGSVSLVFAGMFLLCVVLAGKWLVWRQKQAQLHVKRQNERELQDCRIKLSSLLGSIGAPPLTLAILMDEEHDTLDCKGILKFARAHVDLIKQVDCSLEKLRTSVGMSLRSTLASVERVELASLLGRNNSAVVLSVARRMLCQVMMDEYESLYVLLPNDVQDDDSLEVPNVITLAWLKSLRLDLADLLSFQLSRLLFSSQYLCDAKLPDATLQSQLMAKESTEYLTSMFSLSQETDFDSDFDTLRRQFDKASVALWACQASCESNKDKEDDEIRVLEFLEHFETLLHSVGNVKERLTNRTRGVDSSEHNEEDENDSGSTAEYPVDSRDYEDIGASFDGVPPKSVNHAAKNKTVVFSGSGSAQWANKKDQEAEMENETILPRRQYVTVQGVVLTELQQRLAKMDPAQEVDANGNDVSEVKTDATVHRKESSTSSSMFLGASGDMLSELKNMIGNGSSCEVLDS